jgi:hypothetical protein
MADDPLAPSLSPDPAPAGSPTERPKGGSFDETIRSIKDLKPEQADAILAAHKSDTDAAITGVRKQWEEKELPQAVETRARKIADEVVNTKLAIVERTARNKEIVSEEFGISLRGKDGQPSDESKEMGQKIAETCKKLGIDKNIALSTDEGMRGLLVACGYVLKAVPEKDEFGPASGLPSFQRRAAAAAAAKDPSKRTVEEQVDIDNARAVQELIAAGGGG